MDSNRRQSVITRPHGDEEVAYRFKLVMLGMSGEKGENISSFIFIKIHEHFPNYSLNVRCRKNRYAHTIGQKYIFGSIICISWSDVSYTDDGYKRQDHQARQ